MSIGTPPVTVQGVIADGLAGKTNIFGTLRARSTTIWQYGGESQQVGAMVRR